MFVLASTFAVAGGEIIPAMDTIKVVEPIEMPIQNTKDEPLYKNYKTKLMWQDEVYGDEEDGAYKHNQSNRKAGKWNYANSYCQELYYAGYSDWRLPKVSELVRLYGKPNGLNQNISVDFWSSTPSSGNKYWSVYAIMEGQPYEHNKQDSQYIRCVRTYKR